MEYRGQRKAVGESHAPRALVSNLTGIGQPQRQPSPATQSPLIAEDLDCLVSHFQTWQEMKTYLDEPFTPLPDPEFSGHEADFSEVNNLQQGFPSGSWDDQLTPCGLEDQPPFHDDTFLQLAENDWSADSRELPPTGEFSFQLEDFLDSETHDKDLSRSSDLMSEQDKQMEKKRKSAESSRKYRRNVKNRTKEQAEELKRTKRTAYNLCRKNNLLEAKYKTLEYKHNELLNKYVKMERQLCEMSQEKAALKCLVREIEYCKYCGTFNGPSMGGNVPLDSAPQSSHSPNRFYGSPNRTDRDFQYHP